VSNDKVFGIYAVGLIGMVALMWASLVAVGVATMPSMAFLVEHVALGVSLRAAYKSFAGFDWLFAGLELAGFMTPEHREPAHVEPDAGLAAAA
jgi:hypothetical protein